MSLNIKSERAHELARQLALETGKSMTAAIEHALEDALERVRRESDFDARKARIREIKSSFGPVPAGVTSDHSDLYGDDGLPA